MSALNPEGPGLPLTATILALGQWAMEESSLGLDFSPLWNGRESSNLAVRAAMRMPCNNASPVLSAWYMAGTYFLKANTDWY